MRLVVGLGNPGSGYAGNRHNIGFMAADTIVRRLSFGPWRSKHQGLIADRTVDGEKVLVLKPLTWMNNSGRSVGEAARFLKIPPEDVIVLYDEIELAPGKLRVKQGGGHAGHNGIRDIDAHLGNAFWRVRLGVGRPREKAAVHGYVLSDFAKADREWLEPLLDAVADHLPVLLAGDEGRFMNRVTLATRPPDDEPKKKKTTGKTEAGPAEGAAPGDETRG